MEIVVLSPKNAPKRGDFRVPFGHLLLEKRRFPPMKRDSKFAPKTTKWVRSESNRGRSESNRPRIGVDSRPDSGRFRPRIGVDFDPNRGRNRPESGRFRPIRVESGSARNYNRISRSKVRRNFLGFPILNRDLIRRSMDSARFRPSSAQFRPSLARPARGRAGRAHAC